MNIKVMTAVIACKCCRSVIRLVGRGGTDLPGRVALKICPDLLGHLAKGVTTIVVTGTNGKTTTSRMIEQALADSGISYFANKSGANLLSGVTAEFAVHSTIFGRCRYTHGLIEADEAAFKYISKYLDPSVVVVTNVFRDQLDRYGEVTHTLENIRISLENCPNAKICINADDSLCTSLKDTLPNEVVFYGVNVPLYEKRVGELSDAPYCIRCKHEYVYDHVTYGHLGSYRCPACGYSRPEPSVAVRQVISTDMESSRIVLSVSGEAYETKVNLPGAYNIYNACSAMAAGTALGLSPETVSAALSSFACGFGRMEKFAVGQTELRMILIKNPTGCNQVLNFLRQMEQPFIFTACLNDRTQDGTDVSWIWDVDFEQLAAMGDRLVRIYVSGIRAEDMALRFYYAGVPMEKLIVEKDHGKLLSLLERETVPVFAMPTYTAMLALRSAMSKRYGLKEFWE